MGRPGTYPASESFTCNWSYRLLPSLSLFRACFISAAFFFPKPTSQGAKQHAELPTPSSPPAFPALTGPTQHLHDFQSTPDSLGQYQQTRKLQFCIFFIHLSLFSYHSWGKYKHLCTVQLLEEQMGNKKIDDSKASSLNISPFKMYLNYFA